MPLASIWLMAKLVLFLSSTCFLVLMFFVRSEAEPGVTEQTEVWDYLMFTQVWPESICFAANEAKAGSCKIPSGASGWTVHGVWPNLRGKHYPSYCDTPLKHFEPSKIKSIEKQLDDHWPNLIVSKTEASLWKHEWEKHGSCAATLPALHGELKYFQHGIDFNRQFNVLKMLSDAGIAPSATATHTSAEFHAAVNKSTNHYSVVDCVVDKKGVWMVADVRICLDKNFSIIDCEGAPHLAPQSTGDSPLPVCHPCPHNHKLLYLPLNQ